MADILDSLLGYLRGLNASNGVMRTAPGETYGPAVSRITRTPIRFTENLSAAQNNGEYDPATKTIAINPKAQSDVPTMIRHESIHALMDQVPGSGQMAAQSSGFPDIAKQMAGVGGDPSHEAVAYLGSYPTSQFRGLSDQIREGFLNDFGSKLSAADPVRGSAWSRLRK